MKNSGRIDVHCHTIPDFFREAVRDIAERVGVEIPEPGRRETEVDPRERYYEAHDLITKAWTATEPFPWNGKYFQLPCVNTWPRPVQQLHPEGQVLERPAVIEISGLCC